MTEEEREASIDNDDECEFDWSTVKGGIPGTKRQLTVRFDADIVERFKAQGGSYQTRMNAVLGSFVDVQKECTTTTSSPRQRRPAGQGTTQPCFQPWRQARQRSTEMGSSVFQAGSMACTWGKEGCRRGQPKR